MTSGEQVWRLPRTLGEPDAHGNVEPSWPPGPGAPGAIAIEDAKVAPASDLAGEAAIAGREAVVSNVTLYLPPGSRVAPVDRMAVREFVYEVIGEPGVWVAPWLGIERGVVVTLKRTEG